MCSFYTLFVIVSFPLQLVLCTCTFDTCTNKDQSIDQYQYAYQYLVKYEHRYGVAPLPRISYK